MVRGSKPLYSIGNAWLSIVDKVLLVVGYRALKKCSNLHTIYIPDPVVYFGADIFAGCDHVVIVCDPGSAAETYAGTALSKSLCFLISIVSAMAALVCALLRSVLLIHWMSSTAAVLR